MATWSSGTDVLADLDELSEFSAGCTYTKDIPIVAYSSYGRGTFIQEREPSPPPSPMFTWEEDAFLVAAPRNFKSGIGRGDRIMALSRHRQDEESLQRQLRIAMGPGYSNELIENFWRGDSPSDHSSELGQYEDIENMCETPSATTTESTPSNESPTTIGSSSPFSEPQDTIVLPVKEVQRKPPRKNRNALLNSLLHLNKENKIDNGVSIVEKNVEMVEKNPVPEKEESRTIMLYVPPPMRVKTSEIPPERVQSSKNTLVYVPPPMRARVSQNKAKTELENEILKNLECSKREEINPSDIFKKTDFGFNYNIVDFPPL